jgi:hypothetical protein
MPTSVRYLPIRDALCGVLAAATGLADIKAIVKDAESFGALAASQLPALGVFFAQSAGEEVAQWAGARRDHRYWLEVRVAVRSLESAQVCEDLLFSYIEAMEDALRTDATLGGVVRNCAVGLASRTQRRAGEYWQSEAGFVVLCEKSVN